MIRVTINVKSRQIRDDSILETKHIGELYINEHNFTLKYNEEILSDEPPCLTTVIVEKGMVTILREGNIKSRIVIEKDVENNAMYVTPYGITSLKITGKKIECNITKHGGYVNLIYQTDEGNNSVTTTILNMKIKEVK